GALRERQRTTEVDGKENRTTNKWSPILAQHIAAVNAFDTIAIVSTFADDAFVHDNHRELWGIDAIRRWVEKELVGDKVTIDVREVVYHCGYTILRDAYSGEYAMNHPPAG